MVESGEKTKFSGYKIEIDKNRIAAFETLVKFGVFVRMEDLDLYHGRTNKTGEAWEVDPRFNNSDNETNHRNMNAVTALNAGSFDVAKRFAMSRSRREGGKPEVHKIVASPNSYIVNVNFDMTTLSVGDRRRVIQALNVLSSYGISQLDPAKFEDRKEYEKVYLCIKEHFTKNPVEFISFDFLKGAYKDYVSENYPDEQKDSPRLERVKNLFVKIAGAVNARKCCILRPDYILDKFATQKDPKFRNNMSLGEKDNGEEIWYPLNMQYVASWLSANNVVGIKGHNVNSVTVDDNIEPYYLFDLESIATEKQEGDKVQTIINEFGELSKVLSTVSGLDGFDDFLRNSSPEQIMDYFRKDGDKEGKGGVAELYGMRPSNLWEGFSIGEHTETLLRGFEHTYEDKLPPSLLPFIKIIILAHDLGKGTCLRKEEKKVNCVQSTIFFNRLNIPENIQKLMLFIINESQSYTTAHYVKKIKSASSDLRDLCSQKLQECFGTSSEDLVTGLVRMCEILQTCDSGAYTRCGVTRDEKTGIYYFNGNNGFTAAFEFPSDLQNMALKFKEPEM